VWRILMYENTKAALERFFELPLEFRLPTVAL
jgi:hypothetical protein